MEDHQWDQESDLRETHPKVITVVMDVMPEKLRFAASCVPLALPSLLLSSEVTSTSSNALRPLRLLRRRSLERRNVDGKNGRRVSAEASSSSQLSLHSSQLLSSTLQLSRLPSTLSHQSRRSPRIRKLVLSTPQTQLVSNPTTTKWFESRPS